MALAWPVSDTLASARSCKSRSICTNVCGPHSCAIHLTTHPWYPLLWLSQSDTSVANSRCNAMCNLCSKVHHTLEVLLHNTQKQQHADRLYKGVTGLHYTAILWSAVAGARTRKAGPNTVRLHLLSFLRCLVCGDMELSINMGRPLSSGAYSTTDPDGNPEAAPSEATVDSVPILQCSQPVLCIMAA